MKHGANVYTSRIRFFLLRRISGPKTSIYRRIKSLNVFSNGYQTVKTLSIKLKKSISLQNKTIYVVILEISSLLLMNEFHLLLHFLVILSKMKHERFYSETSGFVRVLEEVRSLSIEE